MLTFIANMNLELHKMDVNTVLLDGELNGEIDMVQPKRFVVHGQNKRFVN